MGDLPTQPAKRGRKPLNRTLTTVSLDNDLRAALDALPNGGRSENINARLRSALKAEGVL